MTSALPLLPPWRTVGLAAALVLAAPAAVAVQERCYVHDKTGNLVEVKSANLMTDPANCGACGRVCPALTPLCTAGACRACGRLDADCDGVETGDNCPLVKNPLQEDLDGDGRGDVCDNCPSVSNADQLNTDHADDGGDACDPDDDNDFCLDPDDDKPLEDSSIIGWRVAENCPDSATHVYGWDGRDADGDGRRNCADDDDDDDGIVDANDRCPIDAGDEALSCMSDPTSCPVTVPWNVCQFGGCNAFLLLVVSVINPPVIVQKFTLQAPSRLFLLPGAVQALADVERAVSGQTRTRAASARRRPAKLRLEIWSRTRKGTPGRFISTLAVYDPAAITRLEDAGSSALLLIVKDGGASMALQRVSLAPDEPRSKRTP